jgi:hypothetical protein
VGDRWRASSTRAVWLYGLDEARFILRANRLFLMACFNFTCHFTRITRSTSTSTSTRHTLLTKGHRYRFGAALRKSTGRRWYPSRRIPVGILRLRFLERPGMSQAAPLHGNICIIFNCYIGQSRIPHSSQCPTPGPLLHQSPEIARFHRFARPKKWYLIGRRKEKSYLANRSVHLE